MCCFCEAPAIWLTWPCRTACPDNPLHPRCPLLTSYPVAGAFAGGAAEISPFCLGSGASSMLVAKQQPLAHHYNFRGWYWLPIPPDFGVPPAPNPSASVPVSPRPFLCHPLDPDLLSTLQNPLEFYSHGILEASFHHVLTCRALSLVLTNKQKNLFSVPDFLTFSLCSRITSIPETQVLWILWQGKTVSIF